MRTLRTLFIIFLLLMAAWHLERGREAMRPGNQTPLDSLLSPAKAHLPEVHAAGADDLIYFAPAANLERVDIGLIDQSQHSIDVAMYAFTDRTIAQALVRAAARGVQVRVYRDRSQYEEERARHSQVGAVLATAPTLHIRVKGSDELMHVKAMLIDGNVLRDGSGNWSVSAARYQDNQVSVTHSPQQSEAFARDFAAMWSRSDNLVVQ